MFNENKLIEELRSCDDKKSIIELFKNNNIADTAKQIEYLNKSMYSPRTFLFFRNLDSKDKLDLTIEIFLMKDWKINEYYEKAGF
ncbi:hypothetical protein OFS07_02085 [Brachyspira hyodysenteriae]|nr:hypothetical protein [Brachyspira hyodysenteriae]MDA0065073.1 hypothetical protein [Brachyspira hyodysenteriae]